MPLRPFLATLLCLLLPLTSHAWHRAGHEVVAAIAWDRMTPKARAAVSALLKNAPENAGIRGLRPETGTDEERDRTQFILAALWADDVRDGPRKAIYHQSLWHYADYFWEQSTPDAPPKQRDDLPQSGDLITKLVAVEASLRAPGSPSVSPSKASDLAWLLHLMGDIAMPLHCSGRITDQEPKGDKGGNTFSLSPIRGSRDKNLHFYWDHVLEREYEPGLDITEITANLQAEYPLDAARLELGQYARWARVSQQVAMQAAYPATLRRDAEPPDDYRHLVKHLSQQRLALAGYRLGATLNAIFAP